MLKRIGDAAGGDSFTGVHAGNVFELNLGKLGMAGDVDRADVRGFTRSNVKQKIDLLGISIGDAFDGDPGAIVTVLLQKLADVLHGTIAFVAGIEFTEFEL